ncbi:MAG: hypothetical protein GAK31_00950 [Stenotrophomonas maltophilia]|uniref:Uncharacterized protein n=1 Tax=Stenotrophomonas maltophilia TaxID=40324 RepID=A0A7V8JNF8_STEMA|nr:MAG: hypothetical protein GAK31_00950 [Stenotrophomonas maltophilia]
MNAIALRLILALALVIGGMATGWTVRGWRSDAVEAKRDAGDAKVAAENVAQARHDDAANQSGVAQVERERVARSTESGTEFKQITREVIRYVQANPAPDGCNLGDSGVRIWRAASAGKASAEPDDSAGANRPVSR